MLGIGRILPSKPNRLIDAVLIITVNSYCDTGSNGNAKGAAGFQGNDVQRFTVYLTAYWGEPETPYINFVTANTEANVQGKYEEQFIGSWYNKTNGNPIYDGDTTPESDKIKVAIPVISFLDMDEVMSGGDGSQTGVTVTMTRNTLLNYMRSQGGDNLWYALDESIDPDTNKPKNHDYIW